MEIVLLLIGIAIVAALFSKPAPQSHVVFIPVEVATAQSDGLGCLPVIVVGLIILLIAGAVRF
jgi:hypothetical protein